MHTEITLEDLYVEHLKDMHSAEVQITMTLPKIIKAAQSSELKKALERHLKETENHVTRLEKICQQMGVSPRGKKCVGMEGLLEEGKEVMAEPMASPHLMDSALIGGCQKVEHYEIRSYNDLRDMAEMLGDIHTVDLLTQSLREEQAADEKLTQIGENIVSFETVWATVSVEM